MEIFEHELQELRQDRKAEFVAERMVVNRVNNRYALHKAYQDVLKSRHYRIFTVHQSTGISDFVPEHSTVFEYDPKNRNLAVLETLAAELAKGDNDGTDKN